MENIQEKLNELKRLIITQGISQKEVLTLEETAEYLSLSKSAIYKLTSNGSIPFYRPNGKKLYFKRSELDNWIFESKVDTTNEVFNYLSRTNKTIVS